MTEVGSMTVGLEGLRICISPLAIPAAVPFEVDNSAVLTAVFRLGLEALWIQAEGDEQLSFQVVELAEEIDDGGFGNQLLSSAEDGW